MSGSLTRSLKKMQSDFTQQWADKFNGLLETVKRVQAGVGSIAGGVAQNLASVKANLDANGDALEQFDIFNQIWAKMFLKLAERTEQANYLILSGRKLDELDDSDRTVIKDRAREWFGDIFQAMKVEVQEERDAYIKELRAKAAEVQKEMDDAKKEGDVAEQALRGAEQNLSVPGGEGSEIPAGAEVFGG